MIVGALAGILLLGCVVALLWWLRSPEFADLVRGKVVEALEGASGGRVELQSFHWSLSRLEFEATGLTIHGSEAAKEAPLARVDKLYLRAHLVSLFKRQVDLTYLQADHPQVHVMVYPDGRTNLPEPQVKGTSDPVKQLFDLAISRIEVRDGVLQFNEQRIPFDFSANDVAVASTFDRRDRRYDGTLRVGKTTAKYKDYREAALEGEVEFSAWQKRAQIKQLKLQSQQSSLELSGTVDSFTNPQLSFDYKASVDLPQAAAIMRVSEFRSGTADLKGSGTYSSDQYSLTGKLAARNVNYAASGSQLRNASLSGDYRLSNAGIQLSNLAGHMLGGNLSGRVEVSNAVTNAGQAQLKVSGVSLADASRMLSSRSLPLDKMPLESGINGEVKLAWKGSPARSTANFDLTLVPPAQVVSGRQAVSGTVRGSYELATGALELRPLQLSTKTTQLEASGRIARSALLNVNLQTTDLSEVDAMLTAIGEAAIPVDLTGHAGFTGTVSGSLRAPEVNGQLQATHFTYLYTPSQQNGSASATPRQIHIDSLAGDVLLSSSSVALHHAVITTGGATLNVDGSASLADGNFTDSSPFELHAAVRDAEVSHLQRILGTDYPVTGSVNLKLQASGTKANPQGHGSFVLTNAALYGRPIESLAAEAALHNDDLQLTNLKLKAPGGTVQGSGSYNLETHELLANLKSDDIQLAHVPELQLNRLSSAGIASFKLHASGTPEKPVLDAHLQMQKLVLNDEHVGDLTLDAVTQGQQLVVTGRSNFKQATLTIDGTVALQKELPANFEVHFVDVDIDPFLTAELKGKITAHSGVAGKAQISGPLREPRALTGRLTIDKFHAEVAKVPIQSDGPLEVVLANESLEIKRFVMSSADTQLRLAGNVQIGGKQEIQMQATGSLNMALLQTFNPDLTSTGKADLDVSVRGTVFRPVMTGTVDIAQLSLSDIDLPAALSDVNGRLAFNQNRLEIEKLTGRVGGGPVKFAGYITYANGVAFNMSSDGTDIRFRYSGISVTANQQLKLQGTLKNAMISGDITITRFAQIPSADLSAAFASASVPAPNAASPLNNLHLDIHVRSAPEVTVQTSLAKLSGDADLRVKGTALNPVLLGRVNIAQGDLKINGQKYYLERGDLTFANPVRIDPILDVEAQTRVRDFDITIGLHGTLERLTTTYRSDPPLSSEDIISLLAFGRTQQEYGLAPAASGAGLGEATGNAVLGAAINQLVSNRVSRLFGVSAIRINPAAGGPDNNPNARLTVEQQVSSDVTITYITNLARSAQQVLEFEYNITRDYTITAVRDENGVVSFDLLIRKRKK